MTQPSWMPEQLAQGAFSVAQARQLGIGRARRDTDALKRPFYGVRNTSVAQSPIERAREYRPRLKETHAFAGVTALRLLGLPWPTPWRADEILEIAVPGTRYAPSSRGVQGHRIAEARFETVDLDGLRVLAPHTAMLDVADRLELPELVGVIDALITPSERYPGLRWRPMVGSIDALELAADTWGVPAARSRARAACAYVRRGVDSFPESLTRASLVLRGVPEPELQWAISTDRGIAHADMAWPQWWTVAEYEGRQHLTDSLQWNRDIQRYAAMEALGWTVIRVTAEDLHVDRIDDLAHRVVSSLRRRGWRPSKRKSRYQDVESAAIRKTPTKKRAQ